MIVKKAYYDLSLKFIAIFTVATLKTVFLLGGFNCYDPFTEAVTVGRDILLSNQHLVTGGAMLTCGKSVLGTGSRHCCINYLPMTECRYGFLSNEYFVTYGAMLTFGKTFGSTGNSYCLIDNLGMAERLYSFLS